MCACQATYAAMLPAPLTMGEPPLTPETQPTRTLEVVAGIVNAAEPIYERLLKICEDESVDYADEDSDFEVKEMENYLLELNSMIRDLGDMLLELASLPSDSISSEGKTVLATREYLIMLRDMAGDIHALGRYAIDLYKALMPMDLDFSDNFMTFAMELFDAIDECMALLDKITPPSFIAHSHRDVEKRLTEFQDFSIDFWIAVALDDPLRLYSCMYRMNRIAVMFDICDQNLTADLDVQQKQAENRMKGPIKTLHDELHRNLALFSAVS